MWARSQVPKGRHPRHIHHIISHSQIGRHSIFTSPPTHHNNSTPCVLLFEPLSDNLDVRCGYVLSRPVRVSLQSASTTEVSFASEPAFFPRGWPISCLGAPGGLLVRLSELSQHTGQTKQENNAERLVPTQPRLCTWLGRFRIIGSSRFGVTRPTFVEN